MTKKTAWLAALSLLTMVGCRPKPMDISVPQKEKTLVVSSACPDGKRVFVGATYSLSALQQVMDTTARGVQVNIPPALLVDSGLVVITSEQGAKDTLSPLRPGLFATNHLALERGLSYKLEVLDYRTGSKATAQTIFQAAPAISLLQPERMPRAQDTLVRLKLKLDGVQPGSHYAVSYTTARNSRQSFQPLPLQIEALHLFQPKQLELFTADIDAPGSFSKELILQVKPNDTVLVQVGQVAGDYFQYLHTYKRTGSLINQLTGEPINLPSNSSSGLGFFALYQPILKVYDLNRF